MNAGSRIVAALLLAVPLWTAGCLEPNLDEPFDDAGHADRADTRADAGVDSDDPTARAEPDDETGDADEPEADEDTDDADEEADDEKTDDPDGEAAVARQDLPETDLVVDEDDPELEIIDVSVEEGRDAHYVSVTCHDPQVDQTRWVSRIRRRVSRRCDIDLATLSQALTVQTDPELRIAPTPRGAQLIGDFEKGEYDLEILAGVRTDDGAVLHEKETRTLEVPQLSQSISVLAEGRYLPTGGWDQLKLEHRNVDDIDLKVRHVPRENLSFWIARSGEEADETTSNLVVDTTVSVPERLDETLTTTVDLDNHLGDPEPGLYEITAKSDSAESVGRLQVTDVNLVAKRHETDPDAPWADHVDVWALQMETTEPTGGVHVDAIRPSGESMGSCRTDRHGHCRIELTDDDTDPTPPVALLAQRGEDLTYLKFDDLRIEDHIEAVDGPAYRSDRPYLATVYGDRDLYRPGDEVHLTGALRDTDYTAPTTGTPLELTVHNPQRDVVAERSLQTDEVGTFETAFTLSDIADTGRWTATLAVGTRRLETYSFHVEEFVPERMEVDVDPTAEIFVADEEPSFEIEAQYLFGAGAEGNDVELTCRLVPVDAPIDDGDFSHGPLEIEQEREIVDLGTREDVVGTDDTVEMSCPGPDTTPTGPMRVEATVAVAEGGSGRTTHGAADATLVPADHHVGLKSETDELEAGDNLSVAGRLVDHDGQLVDTDEAVELEFYNIRRHRSWQRDSSTGRYRVHYDYQLVLERTAAVEPTDGTFDFETTVAGVDHAYLVRADYRGARTELQIDGPPARWRFSHSSDRTPDPRRPSEVSIDVPEQVTPGKPATVQFDAPFDGRALMSIETDEVVEHRWIDADEGHNEWTFNVETDEPNVYVSALVVRDPLEAADDAFMPQRAFGSTSATVDRSRVETDVAVSAPDEVRPGRTLEIELEAAGDPEAGPAVATVAAVDEGILQLTDYDTPDPVDAMWNERAPGVTTFDTVGWATRLPTLNPSSATGGGAPEDAEASEGRIMPFEPVAMWSGRVKLNDDGRATVRFDVPNYSGRLRVMSSVFTPETMGADERDVLVRDPLTVQSTLPRHMTEDDEADIPVFVTNLTDEARRIDVDLEATPFDVEGFDATPETDDEPVLEFPDGDRRTVELAPGESTTTYVTARALVPAGGAEVDVRVSDHDYDSVDTGTIPFRPRGPTERTTHTVDVHQGANDLTDHLDGWVAGSEHSNFFLSTIAEPEAFDHLEYLIRYPFGCAEQTISSARPLVQLPNIVEAIDPQFASGENLDDKIQTGVDRMLSMQQSSGAVGFWPLFRSYSTSLTARTLDFFVQARDNGFAVPDERIESAADWLTDNVSGTPDDAFEHYTMARSGHPQTRQIREAIEKLPTNPDGRQLERSYLLKAALYLAGDRSYEEELRDPDFETGEGGRSEGRFYSHHRQRAMMLQIFVELFGRDDAAAELADMVTERMLEADRGGLSTQELVWSLEALAGWYDLEGVDELEATLEADGRSLRPDTPGGHPTWSIHRASEFDDLDLVVETGEFDGQLSLLVNSRGVRQDPDAEIGGEGLVVDRTYLDEDGDEIDEDDITPGDVVYANVELEDDAGSGHRDLALVDRLPAALEIENPDLGAAQLPGWAEQSWETDHVNIRDDRIEMFGGLSSGESVEVVYPTRATMSGDFYAPSVEVEGMYDPETWARGEPAEVTIADEPES